MSGSTPSLKKPKLNSVFGSKENVEPTDASTLAASNKPLVRGKPRTCE